MSDAGLRQRLFAILAADAVGYSRLMAHDERATLIALEAAREVFRGETAAHRGRVVDTAGDSVLAVFDTATGAIDSAIAIQRRLAAAQDGVAVERRLCFRIGLHLGDVIEQPDGSVYGNGVNVAARLQSLAEPGGIWLSDALHAALAARPDRSFEDRGHIEVKNIAEPVHALRLQIETATGASPRHWRWLRASRPVMAVAVAAALIAVTALIQWRIAGSRDAVSAWRPMSLAVGSFTANTDDARTTELADRLREDLQRTLTGPFHRNTISVIALDEATAPSAGSTLTRARSAGARFLVEGRLRPDATGYVAVVQVFDVPSSTQQWSADAVFKSGASTAEHTTYARKLARQVASLVFEREARRVAALPPDRLSAVELIVHASAVYESDSTRKGIDLALGLTDRALALDGQSAVALTMKAFLLANRYDEEASPDHDRYAREIDALTARAIAIDAQYPFAWLMRASALQMAGRWASALEAVEKVIQMEPGNAMSAVDKADLLLSQGRPAEALQVLETDTVRMSGDTWSEITICHAKILLAQSRTAIEACERAVGRDPKLWSAHLYLAAARAQANDVEQARASLAVIERMSPGHTIERLRSNLKWRHPEYQRLADAEYYPGLRKAGLPER